MAFLKKGKKKVSPATAPEEPETEEEIKHIEDYDDDEEDEEDEDFDDEDLKEKPKNKIVKQESKSNVQYKEVPVCLSQAQVNNIIIENNIMLKEIMLHISD